VVVRDLSTNRDAGHSCQIHIFDGTVGIAYFEEESNGGPVSLKYSQAADNQNEAFLTPTTPANGLPSETYTANDNLALGEALGSVTVLYAEGDFLRFKRCFFFQSSTPLWPGTPVTVASDAGGEAVSMAWLGTVPGALYGTQANKANFVSAIDANGAEWNDPVEILDRHVTAAELAMVSGLPLAVLAESGVTAPVRFVAAKNAAGSEWEFGLNVANAAASQSACLIRGATGWPVMAFFSSEGDGHQGVYSATAK
jgi:hypothetical protein